MKTARAVAHANIAFAKYWGKGDLERNLPAVPSLSLTLDGLATETVVTFDESLAEDRMTLDGRAESGKALIRAVQMLDKIRAEAGLGLKAEIRTSNNFPTAAGLASSASGFAALALAARRAAGLPDDAPRASSLARASSASAARSVFGGYVSLELGADAATPVVTGEHFPLVLVVAVTELGPKSVGSTEGMQHTRATSPYYPAWLAYAPTLFETIKRAVLEQNLEALGPAMEQSCLMMHASMFAAAPGIVYWKPSSLGAMQTVRELREQGSMAYFTMDAGPHVKVLTREGDSERVATALSQTPGVTRVLTCRPGPDATVTDVAR